MDRAEYLYKAFCRHFPYEATSCQTALLRTLSTFLTSDEGDILVVNGYAGTGKTSAVAAVVSALKELSLSTVLLAPTGRSAKVLSLYAGQPAATIHKHIYRQKSFQADGTGSFSLAPNKSKGVLYIVDEVSLIGSGESSEGAVFGSGDLLADLVSFVRAGVDCRLVLMGDAAQLPPVGLEESPALSPSYMSQFGGVTFATLTTVVRQASGSGILVNATRLRQLLPCPSGVGSLGLSCEGFPDIAQLPGGQLLETLSDAYARYGEEEVVVLCRSNKRAGRYNLGIRAQVLYREEQISRGEKLMVVKNHYLDEPDLEYIANGDVANLVWIKHFEERYGLHFADACLSLPDYGDREVDHDLQLLQRGSVLDQYSLVHQRSSRQTGSYSLSSSYWLM